MHLWWAEYNSQNQLQVKKDDKNEDYVRLHLHQIFCFSYCT